ncbi:hypothetical protein [Chitinophaga arvensicola]|uniref:Uncharacterized protein n=1 Tax=Chitinophaga arvensicola TaxID=29529 RepID=A0A1I0S9M0_9BACT|nr:hypothetical protein [Chitinophaga arvensicola]SEW52870.1 hypothetical protein SAMN04488122_5196 [Chitinophaga arvensicola]
MRKNTNTTLHVWGKPLLVALLSITGLITALVGDGYWDAFSWLALGIPLVMMAGHYFYPKKTE